MRTFGGGSFLTESVSQLVDRCVEVKHFQVELGHEVFHFVYGVQNLNALGVGVESDFVWSGHGGYPTSEMRKQGQWLMLVEQTSGAR